MERIAVIGAGRMGLAMVKHLLSKGYPVAVCDIDATAQSKAVALGATAAVFPSSAGSQASFIILAVGYDEEVNEVVLGEHGCLKTLQAGSVLAVSSTVAPDTVKRLDGKAQSCGASVLDAPICRGRWYADQGKLLALFGGNAQTVARGRAVYSAFCSDIAHLGDVGHGQVGKAINNLLLWINSIGLIEAGRIAESAGIDLPTLAAALMKSSAASKALEDWDQTTFTWALKDMQIVSRMADESGLALPITGAVKELVKEARRIKATSPPKWTGRQTP